MAPQRLHVRPDNRRMAGPPRVDDTARQFPNDPVAGRVVAAFGWEKESLYAQEQLFLAVRDVVAKLDAKVLAELARRPTVVQATQHLRFMVSRVPSPMLKHFVDSLVAALETELTRSPSPVISGTEIRL